MTENEGLSLTPSVPETGKSLTAAKKDTSIMGLLQSDSMKNQFRMALGNVALAERFLRVAITAIRKSPKLQECNTASVLGAFMLSAQLRLDPNTPMGHAYLIPYGKECQFIIGYQGYMELVYRSGLVNSIMVFDWCKNDEYEFHYGTDYKIIHRPAEGDRGEVLGYYAVAKNDNGFWFYRMTIQELEKHKASLPNCMRSDSFANKYPEEWRKKTVIRRIVKMLPKSSEKATEINKIQEGVVTGHDANFNPEMAEQADFEVVDE